MKKIIKVLLISGLTIGAFLFCALFFPMTKNNVLAVNPVDNSFFNYITITSNGSILSKENFKTMNSSSYVYSKNNVTVTFNNPFSPNIQSYSLSEVSNFYILQKQIDFTDATTEVKTKELQINNVTYNCSYSLNQLNQLVFKINNSTYYIGENNYILFSFNYLTKQLMYTSSVTWKANSENSYLTIELQISSGKYGVVTNNYKINFCKAITMLNSDEFLKYTCFGFDAGNDELGYTYTKLPTEKTYNKVQLEFNKSYTKLNPLYFDIDYNGFIYSFELYTDEAKLYLNYLTNYLQTNNTNDIENKAEDYSSLNGILSVDNSYKLTFYKLGRYEIKFYDSSYLLNTDPTMNNFVQTSFYIVEDYENVYKNIYCLFQSYTDDTDAQYIASASIAERDCPTLNTNVKIIVKNLERLSSEEKNFLKVKIAKTTFTGTSQNTTYSEYDPDTLINNFDNELYYEDDAYYEIELVYNSSKFNDYKFYIIKSVKASFSVDGVPYQSDEAYKKESKNFTNYLISSLYFKTNLSTAGTEQRTYEAEQTYENNYTIYYGKPEVDLTVVKEESSMTITFKGVGTIHATIKYGGVTKNYTLSDDLSKTMTFTDYGTYEIHFSDEMGTSSSQIIKYSKPLNTSTIVLVGISGLILLMITAFILLSRRKVATR